MLSVHLYLSERSGDWMWEALQCRPNNHQMQTCVHNAIRNTWKQVLFGQHVKWVSYYLSSKFACQIVDFCKISHEEGQMKEQGHLKSWLCKKIQSRGCRTRDSIKWRWRQTDNVNRKCKVPGSSFKAEPYWLKLFVLNIIVWVNITKFLHGNIVAIGIIFMALLITGELGIIGRILDQYGLHDGGCGSHSEAVLFVLFWY